MSAVIEREDFPFTELTDLLQARAQVAAEHKTNPVYFHAMDAGFHVTFLHPLKVSFLSEVQINILLTFDSTTEI